MKKLSVIQSEIKYLIVLNIKPFINKYNWGKINYPPKIGEWKTFEKNNPTDALNILYTKKKELLPAYISKHDSTRKKQIILLMISNKEKKGWHYLVVNKLHTLARGIKSKHHGGFYCLSYLHTFRTENELKSHEKVCKNSDFCGIVMLSEKDKILEFNQYMKSNKMTHK